MTLLDRIGPLLLRLGVRTSYEAEFGWAAGRFGVVAAAGAAAYLFLRDYPSSSVVLVLLAFTVAYSTVVLALLMRRKIQLAFGLGIILDNATLLAGWWSVTSALAGSKQTDDLWLILIPLVIVGVLRLGWIVGSFYVVLWLAFMSWSFVHYYGPDSYDVEQLPTRIGFTIVIVGLVMRLVSQVKKQRDAEHEQVEAIARVEELKSTLLRAVAHDVRSPITAVRTAAEMLTDENVVLTPEQRKRLGSAMRSGLKRLDRTVRDSFSYAELKAGGADLFFEDLDLSVVIDNAIEMARDSARLKGQRIEVTESSESVEARGDRAWLLQMFSHILANAMEHAPPESAIAVELRSAPGKVEVDVIDEGPPIPDAERRAIFEEYYRGAEPDRRAGASNGLALAAAKRIAEEHGGSIDVRSTGECPTMFTVTLPAIALPRSRPAA